jgi:lipoprotein NlpI
VYTEQGIAYEAKGDSVAAIGAYESAVTAAMDDGAYPRFYLTLLLRRIGKADTAAQYLDGVQMWKDGWPKAIGLFLRNNLPEATFLSEAENSDKAIKQERLCEAYYYAGMLRMLTGDAKEANDLFGKSIATGIVYFNECSLAQIALDRNGAQQK